ncbi:MAG TPA: hypothetical protein VGX92_12035 [Pyrinomonadaceae bacterium]|jgi:uncharacterized alpha/beta hydrolase family protein|nr:hypothetical protein [Pyrinomonadaceae bacterium]
MRKSSVPDKSLRGDKRKKRTPRLSRIGFLVIGVLCAIGLGTVVFSQSAKNNRAKAPKTAPQADNKTYIPTREITVDRQTGQIRKPTAEETKELVDYLKSATNRSTADLPVVTRADGSRQVTLGGRLGTVALARPAADGTMEVRCVTTMEEATEFLGLVESNSAAAQNQ